MTRKEMITEIAKQANCSKRLVRKKLFHRYLELEKRYHVPEFRKAFLDKTTNWLDENKLRKDWRSGKKEICPYGTPNVFDVCFIPSGCIVLFQVEKIDADGWHYTKQIGERLYRW